jgi:hypothetical protein
MLDLADVKPHDFVIDLGSGDGVIVIGAAKRGSRAHGIEYNPDLVELSRRNAAAAGVSDKATFEQADLFESDVSKATVIAMFLLPALNVKLRPRILALEPGTRIVSNTYDMGDWQPDKTVMVPGCGTAELRSAVFWWRWCTALLWIVPAKIEGSWRLPQGELTLEQQYQMVSGTLGSGGTAVPITHGRVRGDRFSFTAADVEYDGRVSGDTLKGTLTSEGQTHDFRATRASR